MIILQLYLTIQDYVKLYSMPIVPECHPLIETLFLVVLNVVDPNLPFNEIRHLKFNVVHQFTPVQTQTFIRPGYKFIIIALIPINGLVILKLNSSTPPELFPHLPPLVTFVQSPQLTIHHR